MNFQFQQNNDGTFTIFNKEIGDIYYSNIGAHKEAMQKFVIPSDVSLLKTTTIKILDVCYGMGYNSKSFVDYCIKNDLNFDFEIDCIELDKNILALGLLSFDKNIDTNIHLCFGQQILEQDDFIENIKKISKENDFGCFLEQINLNFNPQNEKHCIDFISEGKITAFLHNIYYQNHGFLKKLLGLVKVNLILDNLLARLPLLDIGYDYIFHDAFSIRKQPELWSEDVFKEYYRILNKNGKVLTYSNSRVLRRTLENIGFEVKINYDENEKQNGTIAIKT